MRKMLSMLLLLLPLVWAGVQLRPVETAVHPSATFRVGTKLVELAWLRATNAAPQAG